MFPGRSLIVFLLVWQTTLADWFIHTVPPEIKQTTTVTMTTSRDATIEGTQRLTGCEDNGCVCKETDRMVECRGSIFPSLKDINLPTNTEILDIQLTEIREIGATDLQVFSNLRSIKIKEAHKLEKIEPGAFDNLRHLELVSITNTSSLFEIEYGVFGYLPGLKKLEISYGELNKCPNITSLRTESITPPDINLVHNKISLVTPYQFTGMKMLHLNLDNNRLESIPDYAFANSQIVTLSLSKNPLSYLDDLAFVDILDIKEVLLSDTNIAHLPTEGLKYIITLDIQNTPRLTKFPPIFRFESIQVAKLHYFSHCCAFSYNTSENYKKAKDLKIGDPLNVTCPSPSSLPPTPETGTDTNGIIFDDPRYQGYPPEVFDHDGFGKFRDEYDNPFSPDRGPYIDAPAPFHPNDTFAVLTNPPNHKPPINPGGFFDQTIDPAVDHKFVGGSCNDFVPKDYSKVICSPKPDSFNPCSDVMGYSFLRVVVWFIALTALAGNGIVVLVLISQKRKMTVPKFLMCNLAFADLCMGIYLLLTAAVDLHTLGEYMNYTFGWQYGAGCKVAGFISMFSSELSVFTLTVITIERWYTIIYAIDLNKRIRLRLASRIMVGGWLFSILVAMLPLIGVGNYGTTSMCLPFYVKDNTTNPGNVIYVTSILMINALAFLIICACYVKMYVTVRNPNMVMKRKDSKVAKRMAILVFTDFACWAPIAIFGIAGAFGRYFLTTDQSKILIVLFYPINSCANPFLYAIFTKSFRRDLFMLLAKHGMCERRAMKYRPTVTSGPRSMSQINSSTMVRDNIKIGGFHRDSSASVITGVTDSRASVVSMPTLNGSPHHTYQKSTNQIPIPMSPLVTNQARKSDNGRQEIPDSETSANEKLLPVQTVGHESLEPVPEEIIGESRENAEINEIHEYVTDECRENSKLVENSLGSRDASPQEMAEKRWRRADSGIHSIPSPSDEDDEDENNFTLERQNGTNYETVF